jgi:hypothetical protein
MVMETRKDPEAEKTQASQECGAEHSDCPNVWKGTCNRAAGHDGSHHCDRCNGLF